MRTLKKTLCLVLCLAMMAGLCAFGASAKEFTDADEIKNTEAVNLLDGLGIIEGYPDESYQPTKVFNRAEAAKIIAYLLLGKETAEALGNANTAFTDVPYGHWASGYIAYCYDQKIINGVGHDKFDPAGELTAAAWGKMLLCALGYSAENEGMTGAGWDFNVTRLVSKTKLADGMAFAGKTPMTRDNAALLAYNALTVPMVAYEGGTHVTTKDGVEVTVNADLYATGNYLGVKYGLYAGAAGTTAYEKDGFNPANTVKGVITANDANRSDALKAGKTQLNDLTDYNIATSAELLGHYVQIYVPVEKTAAGGYNAKPNEALAIADIGTVKTLAKATTSEAAFKAAFEKAYTAVATNVYKFSQGVMTPNYNETFVKVNADTTQTKGYAAAGDYIFNENGVLVAEVLADFAVVSLRKVSKIVTTEGKESITFSGTAADLVLSNTKDDDKVREYDGIAEKDIVLLSKIGDVYTVTKPETVEGAISAVSADDVITLDGTAYAKTKVAANEKAVTDTKPTKAADMKDKTYKLYLDAKGAWIACELIEGETPVPDVYFVANTFKKTVSGDKGDSVNWYAQVFGMDGKEDAILIKVGDGDPATAEGLYTFAPAADAGQKALGAMDAKPVAQAYDKDTLKLGWSFASANGDLKSTATDIALTAGKGYLKSTTNYVFVNEATANVAAATTAETVTGGVNFKGITTTNAWFVYGKDADGNMIVKTVFVKAKYEDAGVDASTLLYFAASGKDSYAGATTAGYTYTVYDAVTGEEKTITSKTEVDVAAGFHAFKTKDDLVDVTYAVYADTSVKYAQIYDSKIDNSLRVKGDAYATDYDTSAAIIVDTRSAKAIAGTTETAISSLADIAAAKKAGYDVKFDMLLNSKKAPTIIFITDCTKVPAAT